MSDPPQRKQVTYLPLLYKKKKNTGENTISITSITSMENIEINKYLSHSIHQRFGIRKMIRNR